MSEHSSDSESVNFPSESNELPCNECGCEREPNCPRFLVEFHKRYPEFDNIRETLYREVMGCWIHDYLRPFLSVDELANYLRVRVRMAKLQNGAKWLSTTRYFLYENFMSTDENDWSKNFDLVRCYGKPCHEWNAFKQILVEKGFVNESEWSESNSCFEHNLTKASDDLIYQYYEGDSGMTKCYGSGGLWIEFTDLGEELELLGEKIAEKIR